MPPRLYKEGLAWIICLGDHCQRIYPDGHRDLPAHVPTSWAFPVLKMKHRIQKRVVDRINAIWNSDIVGRTQPKSSFAQYPREEKSAGTVRIFIGDAALATTGKVERERQCAAAMTKATGVDAWADGTRKFKTLALEHKLAAKRGSFFDAYFAMDLLDEDAAAPKSNGERTGPAIVRPLLGSILDLAACFNPTGDLDEFAAMEVLRAPKALARLPEGVEERRTQIRGSHVAIAIRHLQQSRGKPRTGVMGGRSHCRSRRNQSYGLVSGSGDFPVGLTCRCLILARPAIRDT